MESQTLVADRIINTLRNLNLKKNQKVGINAKKVDGMDYIKISEKDIVDLCLTAQDIFANQPIFLELQPPVKIVGDIHGQFSDLRKIFDMEGWPPEANYLFLGDYQGRGPMQVETVLLLLAFKVKYPENFFLLRGNHECHSLAYIYGFNKALLEWEGKSKIALQGNNQKDCRLFKKFVSVFEQLPVAALIDDKILCMHGGLSQELADYRDIEMIQRPTDIPDMGILCDLLWADPEAQIPEYQESERGVSYVFNENVVANFTKKFDIDLIARGHQVQEDGYQFFAGRKLVTIFSAANYCGEFDNDGAVMSVDETLMCSFKKIKPQSDKKKFGAGANNSGKKIANQYGKKYMTKFSR